MDYIFHLAALADIVPSIENPEKYFNSNVVATFNLLNNLNIKRTKKFIYLASSTCYGIPKFYPTKESEKINTKYPYALTKNIGEQLITHWSNIYGLKVLLCDYLMFLVLDQELQEHTGQFWCISSTENKKLSFDRGWKWKTVKRFYLCYRYS